ncbi:MAG: ATP-dependent DNA ligase [Candidatus Aenigmarchaeota archaeon]|nr:ATP-dependent DNA ligase [Candidatus Aenigmarchaeota archaeon]
MLYQTLVDIYEKLNATSKRLEKTSILSAFLKNLQDNDVEQVILLLQGIVFPIWDERRLGIADKLVIHAINIATGKSPEFIEQKWKELGDIGDVSANCVQKKTQATLFSNELTLSKVFTNMQQLVSFTGEGTVDKKTALVAELLTNATSSQAKYIARTALGDLRIGLGDGTLRDSIVWACFSQQIGLVYNQAENDVKLDEEQRKKYNEYTNLVQSAYDKTTDFSLVLEKARKGEEALKKITITPGLPLNVMLYQKAQNIADAFATVGQPASIEYKYDGFRLQIHKIKEKILLFTRRLENVTSQFPDISKEAKLAINATNAILEAEIVGYDISSGKYLPFQNISMRIQRKHDIESTAAKYPVHIILFDLLYLDGRDCTVLHYHDRTELLAGICAQSKTFYLAQKIITSDEKEAAEFYNKSLLNGNEGVMMKNLSSPYQPGSRVGYGVKVKSVMDALDVVIVGAEWGEGKRSKWLSSFVIACKNKDEYPAIGRVGTGFKEKAEEGTAFAEMTELLKPHIKPQEGREVQIKPAIVIEVHYEEIQQSPSTAAGYALRFPRFVRLRPDRRPEDASTLAEIQKLFTQQRGRTKNI